MIEVRIETDEDELLYQFPENWQEVSVKQFCNVFSNGDMDNSFLSSVKLLSSLSGIDKDIIEMMSVDDFKMLLDRLNFINDEVKKSEDTDMVIDGEEYFLHTNFNDYTTGEIISIELLLEQAQNNIIPILPDLLCIFLRKKTPKGKIEKYKTSFMERKEMFQKLPISKVYHTISFFFLSGHISTANTKDYILNQEINQNQSSTHQ